MNKLILMLALAVFAFAAPVLAAPPVPKDGYVMNKTSKKVIFNHSTHTSASCESCHHPVNGTPRYEPCATAGCHPNTDPKAKGIDSYFQAMHKRAGNKFDSCVSCHVKVAGADAAKKKALTSCKDSCHA